ncbi:hydroxyphenylacetyl-CoA thioesterase PaaI [Gordonia sp. NPDC003424]
MSVDGSAGDCRIAREMLAGDAATTALGIELLELEPGRAVMAMTVSETMVNGHDITHGGYVFLLADTAFAAACNSRDDAAVAARADIRFIASTKLGDRLIATAFERERFGRNGITDVTVRREADDAVIAEFRGDSRTIRRD